ncbi:MAG: hypothetical protein Q8O54_09425, partial [Brevundimonas sp.]|nr:hypothetical protein [Brevundimonas sp.]
MRLFPVAVSVLALAACSPAEEPAPPAAPEPGAVLAGVDLTRPVRALGTEPFWSVELTGTEMVYSSPEPPEQRAPQSRPVIQGTTASYQGATAAGTAFSVTLVATECSDGMSDRTYPLTARVEIGEEVLNGCAASVDFLMNTDERGE